MLWSLHLFIMFITSSVLPHPTRLHGVTIPTKQACEKWLRHVSVKDVFPVLLHSEGWRNQPFILLIEATMLAEDVCILKCYLNLMLSSTRMYDKTWRARRIDLEIYLQIAINSIFDAIMLRNFVMLEWSYISHFVFCMSLFCTAWWLHVFISFIYFAIKCHFNNSIPSPPRSRIPGVFCLWIMSSC